MGQGENQSSDGKPRPQRSYDLTRGVYRRQYAGFIGGKRINQLSLQAEAWFWRVHAAADDYGNIEADPVLLYNATIGRRLGTTTLKDVESFIIEMERVDLVRRYQVQGGDFLHVVGWGTLQPAGKNGKRVRRYAGSPWDDGSDDTVLAAAESRDSRRTPVPAESTPTTEKGESRCIQMKAGEPREHNHHDNHNNHYHDKSLAAQASAEIAGGANAPAAYSSDGEARDGDDATVLTFPTDGKPTHWALKQSYIDELRPLYPKLDLLAESRAAYAWVTSKPRNRKTAGGMKTFLVNWFNRATNRGPGLWNQPHNGHSDREAKRIPQQVSVRKLN